jgi:hypothetical protein
MYLLKFVHSEIGRNIMSILLGLGLATPPLEEIDNKIYKFDDKCYKLEKNAETCNAKKKIVSFA